VEGIKLTQKDYMTDLNLTPVAQLHYFKCNDCLSPVALENAKESADLLCDCGGESFHYMGRVVQDKLVKVVERCKCNSLCTFASGPCCNCSCSGANHGSGMRAMYRVEITTGKSRPICPSKPKAVLHAVWFRSVKQQFDDGSIYGILKDVKEKMKAGIWQDRSVFTSIYRIDSLKRELVRAKTFKKRESTYAQIQAHVLSATEKLSPNVAEQLATG